jgi:type II secretory pathway component PulF
VPTFAYKVVGGVNGTASPGRGGMTIDAPDRATAVRELLRRGVTPSAIEPMEFGSLGGPGEGPSRGDEHRAFSATKSSSAEDGEPFAGPKMTLEAGSRGHARAMGRAEMAGFIRELSTAIQAGLPLVMALKTIAKQGRSEPQRRMLGRIIEGVEHGHSLGDAVEREQRTFGELTVSLVRAGEASGKLGEVLKQAADLLDKDVKLRRSIQAATLYPVILLLLIVGAIVVVVTFIVPKILESVRGQITQMPWPTRVVQGLADAVGSYWWLIVLVIAGVVYGAGRIYATPAWRLLIDRALLRVPLLGRLLRDVAVARFTRTLGTLTGAGVGVLQSLRITKATLENRAMEQVVDEVVEQVAGGKTIADPMERSGYFPPMLVQIVNLGERSGRLEELLEQAAGAFEDKTEQSVKLFTTALPPVLVVMLACVVGFVVLAILMPLLSVQEAAFR